jgi:catechol 2,3-dioxygenase-like lactoylglutathione lyase family enzyme
MKKHAINLIAILTDDMEPMVHFYHELLGFDILEDTGDFVRFDCEGTQFAVCLRSIFTEYHESFNHPVNGRSFRLSFPCDDPLDVDSTYRRLLEKGVKGIQQPRIMPWKHRSAMIADPDGNIHEIVAKV